MTEEQIKDEILQLAPLLSAMIGADDASYFLEDIAVEIADKGKDGNNG